MPLPSLIEFFKIQFMQQYVRGHLPVSFNEVWITQEARRQNENVEYLLRNSENFYVPLSRLYILDRQPYFSFPKVWEQFKEENIKIIRDKIQFNFKLKEYMLGKLNENFVVIDFSVPTVTLEVTPRQTVSESVSYPCKPC